METPEELISQFAQEAPGRCHSCQNCQTFDLPDQPRHWCRSFGVVLSDTQRQQVRNCPGWKAFSPGQNNSSGINDSLLKQIIDDEEQLLAAVKVSLQQQGLCLRTLMSLAYPNLDPRGQQLDWIDRLELRFPSAPVYDLSELYQLLRANGYYSLTVLIERCLAGEKIVDDWTENTLQEIGARPSN